MITLIYVVFFCSVPSDGQDMCLVPTCPFVTVFLTRCALCVARCQAGMAQMFTTFVTSVATIIVVTITLAVTKTVSPIGVTDRCADRRSALRVIRLMSGVFTCPYKLAVYVLVILLTVLTAICCRVFGGVGVGVLCTAVTLTFTVGLLVSKIIVHNVHRKDSTHPFTGRIRGRCPLSSVGVCMVGSLGACTGLCKLGFCLNGGFRGFKRRRPMDNFFFYAIGSLRAMRGGCKSGCAFDLLASAGGIVTSMHREVMLYDFLQGRWSVFGSFTANGRFLSYFVRYDFFSYPGEDHARSINGEVVVTNVCQDVQLLTTFRTFRPVARVRIYR